MVGFSGSTTATNIPIARIATMTTTVPPTATDVTEDYNNDDEPMNVWVMCKN